MTNNEFIIRLIVGFLLGAAIGLERQWRHHLAGLQTCTLVSIGATLFVMISALTPKDSSPTHIAAQVVSGIGFLGGGVILREGLTVRGLNTAASIWCAAAVGSLAGLGFLSQAFLGALTVVMTNTVLRPLAERINQQPVKNTDVQLCYRCTITCHSKDEAFVRVLLLQAVSGNTTIKLRSLNSKDIKDSDKMEVEADFVTQVRNDSFLEQTVSHLSLEPGITSISWRIIEQQFGWPQ